MAKRIYVKIFAARKMIQVNLSLRYSNIKVTVTCKLQRGHVERSVCPIGFRWRVRKGLFNRHDKAIGLGNGGAYSAEFACYGLLGSDAAYCGTDLQTFRWNLLASPSLVEIYRSLEASSVSHFKYHDYVGGTVHI